MHVFIDSSFKPAILVQAADALTAYLPKAKKERERFIKGLEVYEVGYRSLLKSNLAEKAIAGRDVSNELCLLVVPFIDEDCIKDHAGALVDPLKQFKQVEWYYPKESLSVPKLLSFLKKANITALQKSDVEFWCDVRKGTAVTDSEKYTVTPYDYAEYFINLYSMGAMATENTASISGYQQPPLKETIFNLAQWSDEKAVLKKIEQQVKNFVTKGRPAISGTSEATRQLRNDILHAARADLSALVLGERGTGKEATAFYLHALSPRAAKPYQEVNCAGFKAEFLESELFGHKKGSFTGADKDKQGLLAKLAGGTIFLDEFPEMPEDVQAKLLRFLENGQYRPLGGTENLRADVKIIAGAQPKLLKKGKVRPDLIDRLQDIEIHVPPLGESVDDIRHLVRHLGDRLIGKTTCHPNEKVERQSVHDLAQQFKDEKIIKLCKEHPWQGNVRDLYRIVKRVLQLDKDLAKELESQIEKQEGLDGGDDGSGAAPAPSRPAHSKGPVDFHSLSSAEDIIKADDVKKEYIQFVFDQLETMSGPLMRLSKPDIAKALGIDPRTLDKWLGDGAKLPSKQQKKLGDFDANKSIASQQKDLGRKIKANRR